MKPIPTPEKLLHAYTRVCKTHQCTKCPINDYRKFVHLSKAIDTSTFLGLCPTLFVYGFLLGEIDLHGNMAKAPDPSALASPVIDKETETKE